MRILLMPSGMRLPTYQRFMPALATFAGEPSLKGSVLNGCAAEIGTREGTIGHSCCAVKVNVATDATPATEPAIQT